MLPLLASLFLLGVLGATGCRSEPHMRPDVAVLGDEPRLAGEQHAIEALIDPQGTRIMRVELRYARNPVDFAEEAIALEPGCVPDGIQPVECRYVLPNSRLYSPGDQIHYRWVIEYQSADGEVSRSVATEIMSFTVLPPPSPATRLR